MNLALINDVTFNVSRINEQALTIFMIGFSVVFVALIVIYTCFTLFSKAVNRKENRKQAALQAAKRPAVAKATAGKTGAPTNIDGETFAAIAMALHLSAEDAHDDESLVLTLDIKDRTNSAWNSKIQNINF